MDTSGLHRRLTRTGSSPRLLRSGDARRLVSRARIVGLAADEQDEHAAEMREAEGMDMHGMDESGTDHADEAGDTGHGEETPPLVLEPGASGDVTMTFDDPGMSSTIIGCHVPGHCEAGMRVDVTVAPA